MEWVKGLIHTGLKEVDGEKKVSVQKKKQAFLPPGKKNHWIASAFRNALRDIVYETWFHVSEVWLTGAHNWGDGDDGDEEQWGWG